MREAIPSSLLESIKKDYNPYNYLLVSTLQLSSIMVNKWFALGVACAPGSAAMTDIRASAGLVAGPAWRDNNINSLSDPAKN